MPKTLIKVETLRRLRDQSADYQSGWADGIKAATEEAGRFPSQYYNSAAAHDLGLLIRALKPEEPGK